MPTIASPAPTIDCLGPTLETARLVLRPPRREDFEPWVAFMADEERTRYIGGIQPRAVVWRGLATMVGSWALQGFAMFSVIEKASGRWIGRVGPWSPEGWPGTEVGWGIATDASRRGYASEAAVASMDWAFDHLGWSEVIHTIDPENIASKAVAARLGSRFLRHDHLPPPYDLHPVEVWGQTREQWRARQASRS
jgi:RimJ/RimL family protein N-acetyltransferase